MVALLPAPRPLLVGIVLNRCGRDFQEGERDLLNLLRPHLANAYRSAQARTIMSALDGASDDAVVLVGALGEPLVFTSRARRLVEAFDREQLREWCRMMRSRAPLPSEHLLALDNGRSVEARLLAHSVVALRAARERPDPDSLRALGLTHREQDVLALVAEGRTNKEIAARLDVLPATVKKHLEHVYDKLDVHTRTAAAAAAYRAATKELASPETSESDGR
jgi:DNA-binding CsgD family transcriptional regulator